MIRKQPPSHRRTEAFCADSARVCGFGAAAPRLGRVFRPPAGGCAAVWPGRVGTATIGDSSWTPAAAPIAIFARFYDGIRADERRPSLTWHRNCDTPVISRIDLVAKGRAECPHGK